MLKCQFPVLLELNKAAAQTNSIGTGEVHKIWYHHLALYSDRPASIHFKGRGKLHADYNFAVKWTFKCEGLHTGPLRARLSRPLNPPMTRHNFIPPSAVWICHSETVKVEPQRFKTGWDQICAVRTLRDVPSPDATLAIGSESVPLSERDS